MNMAQSLDAKSKSLSRNQNITLTKVDNSGSLASYSLLNSNSYSEQLHRLSSLIQRPETFQVGEPMETLKKLSSLAPG